MLLARTYSGAPLGSSSDWSGDGIGLLTKEKVQNESDEGANSLREGMQRLMLGLDVPSSLLARADEMIEWRRNFAGSA